MPNSHWENLQDLFHAALALPPAERSAYLEEASNGDALLREAVESLLKAQAESGNFVDMPAYQAAAEMLVDEPVLTVNQTVAHYRIVSLLGEGGMGKVYLAEDTKLHRRVALKFLSHNLTQDQDRLRRFEQEARAASALNHPNILTIYEIGESEDHRFIATELIEGETLRERLRTELSVDDALEISIQIASALVAAHRVGVVHRDIKPENIMIRREDGLVKVLDFGLAKMSRTSSIERAKSADSHTPALVRTGPGVVIGTVAYMSPEQARGESADARTDVWSLGVILYEMIAGTSPFIAATSNEIISGILAKTPTPPLSRHAHDLRTGLDEIVAKALTKNSDQRYQTSQDLLDDLKQAKHSLQLHSERRNSADNVPRRSGAEATNPAITTTRPTSNAEYIAMQVKAHKRGAIALAATVLLGIVGAVAVHEWRLKHSVVAAAAAPQIKSLAVLPLKSLDSDQNYLGVGIADAVIRRISQTGQLTVRPTSAVLKYVKEDTDSLTAARQLSADAVLEGTVQRSGDRLRVSVNLLRTSDGVSLYSDNFDLAKADVFAIQDKVAQEVASKLRVSFDSGGEARQGKKYPTDPRAYELYIKATVSLDERDDSMPQMQKSIDFLKQSINIDSNYALSHAKLAFAYAWTAAAIEPSNSKWVELARQEIAQAQQLDSNLAETHFVHAYLLWTAYDGYQNEAAIRELFLAKQLNPNSCSPDLPAILGHVGLEELATRELKRAREIDPTSFSLIDLEQLLPFFRADADAWFSQFKKTNDLPQQSLWYDLRKGRLDDAQKVINERLPKAPNNPGLLLSRALLLALKGDFQQAVAGVPDIVAKVERHNQSRHHHTYDAACIYALAGNSTEAVRWLKETANTGFPNYPLFERDPFLDRIRKSPEFIQFMADQKAQWDRLRVEFGS